MSTWLHLVVLSNCWYDTFTHFEERRWTDTQTKWAVVSILVLFACAVWDIVNAISKRQNAETK